MQANRFVSCLAGLTGLLLLSVSGVNAIGVTHLGNDRSVVGGDKNKCDMSDASKHNCERIQQPGYFCDATYDKVAFIEDQVKDMLAEQRWVCLESGCINVNETVEDDGEDGCVPVEPPIDP